MSDVVLALKVGFLVCVAVIAYNVTMFILQSLLAIPIALLANYRLKKVLEEAGVHYINSSKRKDH